MRSPSPSYLPTDVTQFVGRGAELTTLTTAVAQMSTTVAVTGAELSSGIGRTALCVHFAHCVAGRYLGGQLYVDLTSLAPHGGPVDVGDVVYLLLNQAGVARDGIPVGTAERAALWQRQLAERRLLVVIDNVSTADQVALLLPQTPGSLVVVISPMRLPDLASAVTLRLGPLPLAEAVTLFVCAAEPTPGPLDDALTVDAVELCGRIPLAIRLAVTPLTGPSAPTLGEVVSALRGLLVSGRTPLEAAALVAIGRITTEQREMAELLVRYPGCDIEVPAAAALAVVPPASAAETLSRLVATGLVSTPVSGRYRVHDVVSQTLDGGTTYLGDDALNRLLAFYSTFASRAMALTHPYERDRRPDHESDHTAGHDLVNAAQATDWLDSELSNLVAVARHAAARGRLEFVHHLAGTLHRHLRNRGHYRYAEVLHTLTEQTAEAAGRTTTQIQALVGLGDLCRLQARHEEAVLYLTRGKRIAEATGDTDSHLEVLRVLAAVYRRLGRSAEALMSFREQLRLAGATGREPARLHALNGIGDVSRRRGEYAEAADAFHEVLRSAPAPTGQTGQTGRLNALNGLGDVYCRQGRYDEAREVLDLALRTATDAGHYPAELSSRKGIADLDRRLARGGAADAGYRRVLDLARGTGDRAWLFEALHGLSLLHRHQRPRIALDHARQAREAAAGLAEPGALARAHVGIAAAYDALNEPGEAQPHWQQALDLLVATGSEWTEDGETSAESVRRRLARPDPVNMPRSDDPGDPE